jgi:putative FmdB family regulatory protein
MPIFEFKCQECGSVFEELFTAADTTKKPACPHCCSKKTVKLLSTFASPSDWNKFVCKNPGSCPSASGCGGSCGHME